MVTAGIRLAPLGPQYGASAVADNSCEGEDVDGLGAAPQERARGGVRRRAGGQDVVDEKHALVRKPGSRLGRHLEGALEVLLPLCLRQPDLAVRPLHAGEEEWLARNPAVARDDARERHGLVEAPAPQAPAVQ